MLDKFWESISSTVAERWLEYIFGPAFLFWVGGLGLYAWRTGWQQMLRDIEALTPFQQGSWLFLTLFILISSSMLIQVLRFPILRLMEGYWPWPFNYMGLKVSAWRTPSYQKKYAELRSLMKAMEEHGELDASQQERVVSLDVWAHRRPVKAKDLLPTRLGNILRAREQSPERKYGLDAIICWPRLWPLLPENVRSDLSGARLNLDRLVEFWFWGLLFLLWTFLIPWAVVISLLWMFIAYSMACQSALSYGDLLESAFDLHRFLLYDALGWARPENTQVEKTMGCELNEFLWRGTLSQQVTYKHSPK
jgi:hypothetical protein